MKIKAMFKKTISIGLIFFAFGLIGCGKEKKENVVEKSAPQVVTGKIADDKTNVPETSAPPVTDKEPRQDKEIDSVVQEKEEALPLAENQTLTAESEKSSDEPSKSENDLSIDEKDTTISEQNSDQINIQTEDTTPKEAEIEKPVIMDDIDENSVDINEKINDDKNISTEELNDKTNLDIDNSETISEGDQIDENSVTLGAKLDSEESPYEPFGIDPFKPLFSEKPDVAVVEGPVREKRKKRIPQTPLERIDLSQLKLVGIVRSSDIDRALVEEVSGKGYVVKKGTYIGSNAGKVIQIFNDKIVVEEEVENVLGNISLKKTELKLQKPFGEE